MGLLTAFLNAVISSLKGGDPLVFGRSGEEIQALREAGIEFEVVPGVTSVLAAAAAAEISLTRRATASSLLIMTGHFASANDNDRPLPDLRSLLASGTTIALYMPGPDARITARKLAAAGLALQTPVAIVSRASTPSQQMILTTLNELPQITMQAKPSILIIGDVVRLSQHDRLRLETLYGQPLPAQPAVPTATDDYRLAANQAVIHG